MKARFLSVAAAACVAACGTIHASPPVDAGPDTFVPDASPPVDASAPDAQFSEAGVDASTIAAPRLVAPLSTATVSSQRPNVTWELGAGVEGAHVEICKDHACTSLETSFDAAGTRGSPSAALAPGVHFVRLSGRVGGTVGVAKSATWQFQVGRRSAPLNTSYGAYPDFDGDGLADVIAAGGSAFVDVFPGSTLGPTNGAVVHVADPNHQASDNFPRAAFGDVDGDGYTDLVVGNVTTTLADATNRITIYRGGPLGMTSVPAWVLHVPDSPADAGTTYGSFAATVTVPGDVNGDGYADILASSITSGGSVSGPTFVFFGHASGPSTKPDVALHGEGTAYHFYPGGIIGDVNGDGYADVLCTTEAAWGTWLFAGGPNGPSDATRHVIVQPAAALNADFGRVVAGAGDLDGDGLPDFAVAAIGAVRANNGQGAYGPGQTYVFRGDTGPGLFAADWTLTGPEGDGGYFGPGAIAGDLDGDGYDDLVIGAQLAFGTAGRAYYFRGGASGVSDSSRVTLTGPGGYFGNVGQAGDVDGDGFPDVLVAASTAGVIEVFYGGKGGISDGSTQTTLNSPSYIYILAERVGRRRKFG